MSLFKFNDDRVKKIMYIHFFCIFMLFFNYINNVTRNGVLLVSFLLYLISSSYRLSNYKYSLKESKSLKFIKKSFNCCFILIVIAFITNGDFLIDPLKVFMKSIYKLTKVSPVDTLFLLIGFLGVCYFSFMSICILGFKHGSDDEKSRIKVVSDNNIKRIKSLFIFIEYELVVTFLLIVLHCNNTWIELLLVFILGFWILPTLKDVKEKIENELLKNKVKCIIESENKN